MRMRFTVSVFPNFSIAWLRYRICSIAVDASTSNNKYNTGSPNGASAPQQSHKLRKVATPLHDMTVTDPRSEQSSTKYATCLWP